jgi:hypothetical protein
MGTGKKTTFILVNVRPEGHPHAPAQKPQRWPPGGAFDSVVGGREGGLPIELHLLHPAFCLCYQKPPACTLMPLPHAIESLSARAIPMVSGPGRNKKPSRAASRISAAQTPIASAVYGFNIGLFLFLLISFRSQQVICKRGEGQVAEMILI